MLRRSPARIRPALKSDAAMIAEVLERAFAEYRPQYTPGGFAATAINAEQVLERMQEGPVWVAVEAEQVVGTVAAVLQPGNKCYLRGMAIPPEARGGGIGPLLLAAVEDYARHSGSEVLTLSTTPFLDRAIRLYERAGFEREAESLHDLFGTPLFTMSKKLV
jgi:ribosomal protein S18 acetylase RimI-like enzyme